MKLNLLKPYPREIFFSWVSRNYLMLGIDQTNFLELLFGKKMITLYSIMPFKDENIEEDREQYLDIVEHNSILTILRPFITTRDYNKVIEGRELNNIRTTIRGYKICPMCYQEDMQKYGETYLRIDHQVEDNYVCHIHQIDLVQIEDYKAEREIKLFEQNNIKSQLQIRHEYKEQIYNEISEMLYEIANEERISCISVEDTQKKYYNRVKELGYYKASEVAQRKLAADIRNYYGEEILSKLGCVINDRGQDDNWVKRLLANTTRRNISPLYHILMIKFLFGNLSNFVDYNKEYMPFGKGP